MKIRPFDDRVIIRQTEASKENEGILVPDQSQVQPAEGWVVAVGPGVIKAENLQLKAIFLLLKWFITLWASFKKESIPDFSSSYDPMQVRVGDYVTFGKYAGTKIKYEGEEYIMVRQSDVFMADDDKKL
jgi:chaperonin GroES